MSKPTPPPPFVNHWPVWLICGWALAVSSIAGFINAYSFSAAVKIPVTHMTGSTSQVAIRLISGSTSRELVMYASVIGAFVAGAAISGMIVGTRVLKPGRRYGIVWAVEGAMLLVAELLFGDDMPWAATALMAAACGLQNAMASSYLGMVLRTTHLTGVLTDIGVLLGHFVKGEEVSGSKAAILFSILAGFLGGGVISTFWATQDDATPLLFLGSGLLVFGLCYYVNRVWHKESVGRRAAGILDE